MLSIKTVFFLFVAFNEPHEIKYTDSTKLTVTVRFKTKV